MPKKNCKNSLYVWCWFVMFASESSHASRFKSSWFCVTPEKRDQPLSALLEYMHWDRTMPTQKKKHPTKKTCTANKVKYTLNHSGVSVFLIYVECHFMDVKNYRNVAFKMRSE